MQPKGGFHGNPGTTTRSANAYVNSIPMYIKVMGDSLPTAQAFPIDSIVIEHTVTNHKTR